MGTEPSTLRDWLREHPPHDSAFTQTIAGVARRYRSGEDFMAAVRELLDEFALLVTDAQRSRALGEQPEPTGDPRCDAFLGALAEHLALASSLPRPQWSVRPERFLDRFWFPSDIPGFRATAIAQSPAAFRRRGIFIARGTLERC